MCFQFRGLIINNIMEVNLWNGLQVFSLHDNITLDRQQQGRVEVPYLYLLSFSSSSFEADDTEAESRHFGIIVMMEEKEHIV